MSGGRRGGVQGKSRSGGADSDLDQQNEIEGEEASKSRFGQREVEFNERGSRIGEGHPRAKLTNRDVERMRFFHEAGGWSVPQICRVFNVPRWTVRDILDYKTRAQTPVPWREPKRKREER